jgi:Flp pilus assembly protein TadG
MVLGCIDFGRFAYNYIAVNNAARAGAEYGVMNSYLPADADTWTSNVQTAATNEMSLQTGFVSANITVTTSSYIDGTGLRRVSVNVQYPFETLVKWPSIPSTATLQANVMMRSVR